MNTVGYFEIHADDPIRAVEFYTEVFDWKFEKEPSIPEPYWRIFNAGPMGGLLKRPVPRSAEKNGVNAFVSSVQVEDFDIISKKIIENGGLISVPKFPVPGKCWQGYFLDSEKNLFGIFQVDPEAN